MTSYKGIKSAILDFATPSFCLKSGIISFTIMLYYNLFNPNLFIFIYCI